MVPFSAQQSPTSDAKRRRRRVERDGLDWGGRGTTTESQRPSFSRSFSCPCSWARRYRLSLAAAVAVALLVAGGCRGRDEFERGERLLAAGDERGAFEVFYEAWSLAPGNAQFSDKLDEVGGRIAARLVAEGEGAETALDFPRALDRLALAIDYLPSASAPRDAYARAWRAQARWERAEDEIGAMRLDAGPGLPAPDAVWRFFDICDRCAALPACPLDRRSALLGDAIAAVEARLDELESRTHETPLPFDAAPLDALRAQWRAFALRVRRRLDAAAPIGPDVEATVASRTVRASRDQWRVLRDRVVAPRLAECLRRSESGVAVAEEALRGVAAYAEGERQERDGDLLGAHDSYRRAVAHHRWGTEAIIAAERALQRWQRSTYDAAQVAIARAEWGDAIGGLAALERRTPGHRDVAERLRTCRRELARLSVRAAEGYEARELPGNALLRYLEARQALPEADASIDGAIERVDGALVGRLWPDFRLEFRAPDDEERRLRHQLWRVDGEFASSVEAAITASFRRAGLAPQAAPSFRVVIEDLDFSLREKTVTREVERGRFLRSFEVARNPRLDRAAAEMRAAREGWLRSKTAYETAPDYLRARQQDRLELAHGALVQARIRLESLAREIPSLAWEERAVPVANIALVGELAARFRVDRLDLEDVWITVRWERSDRVVEAADAPGFCHDPLEAPSREEVLETLADDLGGKLRHRVERALEQHVASYYHRGIERLEAGSLESAVENLATYVFALRGEPPTLQLEEAVRRLEQLTDATALRDWVGGP